MFDRIIDQSHQFGLSPPQARQLLGMLVARIFNPRLGGPGGFMRGMRDEQLDGPLDSWLGPGPNQPLDAMSVERALGAETLERMAHRLQLPVPAVRAASAMMLPDVVHELSEHGDLPPAAEQIPDRFHGWFGNLDEHLADLGHLGSAAFDASAAALGASVGVVGDIPNTAPPPEAVELAPAIDRPARTTQPGNPGRPLALALAAVVAVLLGIAFVRGCAPQTPAPPSGAGASTLPAAGLTG